MTILILFQIFLLLILFMVVRNLYTFGSYKEDSFEDKIKLPVIVYISAVGLSLVPLLGLGLQIILFIIIIQEIVVEDLYYKPGKISKFLFFKKI